MHMAIFFSTIDVTRQCFFRAPSAFGIVNLKPILPGHVLVVPRRVVPRLSDLQADEISGLFSSVQTIGTAIEKAYQADSLTIACQDGKAAGQSIPHVHIHIIPRRYKGDQFENANDDIYPAIEKAERELQMQALRVDDEGRVARSLEEMEKESRWLQTFFQ